MIRAAAIDIGTNSTRLLVADVEGVRLQDVVRRTTVTRLGEGVDANGVLLPAAVERTLAAVTAYAAELGELGATRATVVATSAVRDAANGRAFLDLIEQRFRFPTLLASGDEEAELTRDGVGSSAPGTLIVDVGGGSTELILGPRRTSIDVGSVRLTERFLHDDPPTPAQVEEAAHFTQSLLPALEPERAIGVAGTVAQLHALAGERRGALTATAVAGALGELAALPAAERARRPGMDPARAPVIVGGAIVVDAVLRRYALPGLVFSERDLLDGLILRLTRA